MTIIESDIFFKVFIFTNSYALLRQCASMNFSIEISNKYEEAMEFIMQSHSRRKFHFILIDIECSDFLDSIRLISEVKKDFPEIKRVIVINRRLSAEDEAVIMETFDADKILNLYTTNDFFIFFKNTIKQKVDYT